MNRRSGMGLAALLALALGLSACAPPALVFLNSKYDPAKVQKVALIDIEDYPGTAGSGAIASGIFEKYLLLGGYSLTERRQVDAVMQAQSIPENGSLDLGQIHTLARLLGVDALAFGQITDFSDSSEHTETVDVPLEQSAPVFSSVETIQRDRRDGTVTKTTDQVISGYASSYTDQYVQQTESVDAHVGLAMRLVDAQTGELLWSASSSGTAPHLDGAADAASAKMMRAVADQLKKKVSGN